MAGRFRRLGAVTAVGLAIMMPGFAAEASDAETVTAAREFVQVTKSEETLDQLLPMVSAAVLDLVVKANPGEGRAIAQLVERHLTPAFRERLPDYLEGMAQLYASNFTAAELRELTTFFASPIGKKFADMRIVLTKQGMALGQRRGQQMGQDVPGKLEPELRAMGLKSPI